MSASSRNRTVSIGSGRSSRGRTGDMQDFNMAPSQTTRFFEPCAATASMFLYAQGPSIVCCHHDTLTIERRFSRHSDDVQLLAVDTQSEIGAGRLVVSYDAGQTSIVWDLMSGDEVARFASYEHLTTAAWMRNGNVAFGNTQGNIILFEPTTSEHISSRTIDQIAVTALAPAADCRTFAIGYQNGSLLIATLQPRFTILHNLSTSRAPSPIVNLAWHASSSRQKSDMLAVQTLDGDLRVWSVAKSYNSNDPAKIVRILKRTENYMPGANWMGWSKNGRIIQFSDSETLSWDVRTKHVTFDSIPTLDKVRGLAVYGPGASLFTLGANNFVQQFDLNSPSIMVRNVQHPANLLPPSPPVSIEEQGEKSVTTIASDTDVTGTMEMTISESDDDRMSPFARMARRKDKAPAEGVDRYDTSSPLSSRSGLSSMSKSSAGSKTPGRYQSSVQSRSITEHTYISAGSSMRSAGAPREHYAPSGASVTSSNRSHHKPSKLRNEVPRSPDDNTKVHDLFKYTRSRLSDIPYKQPPVIQESDRLTNDDLRRQMLCTIFGWNGEVADLIRDEMSRHSAGSPARILLAKWLGDIDADVMAASAESMTSSDWMLLALSGIGGKGSQHKLGRAYVQRLLEKGDVHAAATIMIGMGDHNDAIEIYISHKKYMEALILACMFFPKVWERQCQIIKKWGEWAVMHGQQQLAVRCFSCTAGKEPSDPWTSPSAAQVTFQSMAPGIPEILSPPLSPPSMNRGPQRSIAKSSALKLITSFGDQASGKAKFFSAADGGQTPIAAGVTPIAESAISPSSIHVTTAFIRPPQRSQFNTPNSARSNTSAFNRGRLPSIGEIPQDALKAGAGAADLPTPPTDKDERGGRHGHARMSSTEQDNLAAGLTLERAATASPMMMRTTHQRFMDAPPPSPDAIVITKIKTNSSRRNGSRDRIPGGKKLELQPVEIGFQGEVTSPEQSVSSSKGGHHWPSKWRRGPGSVASSVTSNSSVGRSLRGQAANNRTADFIHSLDTAQQYSKGQRSRQSSREGRRESSRGRDGSRDRKHVGSREVSEERGRQSTRGWTKPKRSPTSPVPMSPEDLINLSTPKTSELGDAEPATVRKRSATRQKAPTSRTSSRGSRRRSPESRSRPAAADGRERSMKREGSMVRSPSSPLPMADNAKLYHNSDDDEDYKRALRDQERFRNRHGGNRSTSRSGSTTGSKRDRSGSRTGNAGEHSELSRRATIALARAPSTEHAGDLKVMKDERQRKKEEAARELEERRKSLAQRPQAPPIPHPNQISPPASGEDAPAPKPTPPRSMYARNGPNVVFGLPATPKATRLHLESAEGRRSPPSVPPIPASFAQRVSPQGSPKGSPDKAPEPSLTLLPSTVYQPPVRANIPRSMSAPIPDDPKDILRSRNLVPRQGQGEQHGDRRIDEVIRQESRDERPPPPPLLKELQHLAVPPPPPPAPLPNLTYGESRSNASASIEIVMDDDQQAAPAVPPMDSTVPVLPTPAPKGHSRGRSITESNSIAGRISRATERLRSASRSRRDARTKSPIEPAPYESIPHGGAFSREPVRSPPIPLPTNTSQLPTGLNENELI